MIRTHYDFDKRQSRGPESVLRLCSADDCMKSFSPRRKDQAFCRDGCRARLAMRDLRAKRVNA